MFMYKQEMNNYDTHSEKRRNGETTLSLSFGVLLYALFIFIFLAVESNKPASLSKSHAASQFLYDKMATYTK